MNTTSSARKAGRAGNGEWLESWNPEDDATWDKGLAWRTLWISTFTLTLCFTSWFLASAIAPKLTNLGFDLTTSQLYWLTAMPGLAGGLMRLIWMVLPPIMGTRKMVTLTTVLLLLPVVGWGIFVQDPSTPFWVLLSLSFLSGIGGGAFSGFMPSTSYFFPRRRQGTALGIQAGIGNFGVSLVQLLTPWVIGFSMIGFLGSSRPMATAPGEPARDVWYQNAAYIYIPFIIVGAVLAWTMLRSVPVKANIRQQFDIFRNVDTWWMTLLYIMTFGTFAGLSAQFGLLMKNLYGAGNPDIVQGTGATAQLLVDGYSVPDPIKFVFLGPLVGAAARVAFSPLTDKFGGARWTLISGVGLVASIGFTITALRPDTSSAATLDAGFDRFLWGMLAIFLFSGIGNASTFKQMPMIFERRQAGGVIGWTAAIAAFGPFFFGVGLTIMSPTAFYLIGLAFAVLCVMITWLRYARPGAPKPS
ncbi:MFS transporter [Salinispora arenicola]|uniref:Nitrate/nitrite transporter n=1 Tax=Salinispora arenicola TaxID=168697 RepID=A0A542XJQ1_SALAC|nr:MFS transporter [Salinispora arenicola]MCN0152720.1 MFS transporter [Salinispora arenicola]NIL43568.1 NarK/NasA family nitrate transporter [Salinispora arenicola]NIL58333.1 NarK/NasA family nitrate transporter [Salinispora arenicola]TQL36020.1 NNP family nitrate/nitrite transporter-like MFS transporter [Salinispora arenicola]GIM87499.1 nitrate/nitrite transporter [Salinispora arenicola]